MSFIFIFGKNTCVKVWKYIKYNWLKIFYKKLINKKFLPALIV